MFRLSSFSAFRSCGLFEQTWLALHSIFSKSLVLHTYCLWDPGRLRLCRLAGSVPVAVLRYPAFVPTVLVLLAAYPQYNGNLEKGFRDLLGSCGSGLQHRLLRGVSIFGDAYADLREGTLIHVGFDRRL